MRRRYPPRGVSRAPLPPPFRVGERVSYHGRDERIRPQNDGDPWRTLSSGDVGECIAVVDGRQGTGFAWDDAGNEVDATRDGRSVLRFPGGIERSVTALDIACRYERWRAPDVEPVEPRAPATRAAALHAGVDRYAWDDLGVRAAR